MNFYFKIQQFYIRITVNVVLSLTCKIRGGCRGVKSKIFVATSKEIR